MDKLGLIDKVRELGEVADLMLVFGPAGVEDRPVCIRHKEFMVSDTVLVEGGVLIIRLRKRRVGQRRPCACKRRGKPINPLLLSADVRTWQPLKVGGAVALTTGIHWGLC